MSLCQVLDWPLKKQKTQHIRLVSLWCFHIYASTTYSCQSAVISSGMPCALHQANMPWIWPLFVLLELSISIVDTSTKPAARITKINIHKSCLGQVGAQIFTNSNFPLTKLVNCNFTCGVCAQCKNRSWIHMEVRGVFSRVTKDAIYLLPSQCGGTI